MTAAIVAVRDRVIHHPGTESEFSGPDVGGWPIQRAVDWFVLYPAKGEVLFALEVGPLDAVAAGVGKSGYLVFGRPVRLRQLAASAALVATIQQVRESSHPLAVELRAQWRHLRRDSDGNPLPGTARYGLPKTIAGWDLPWALESTTHIEDA